MVLDRFGPLALLQVLRPEALPAVAWDDLAEWCRQRLQCPLLAVWQRRRGASPDLLYASWQGDPPPEVWAREQGQSFWIEPHHAGQDPHLFLDLRVARRWLRAHCQGCSLLNLFSYSCGVGVAAEAGGASRVVNVDFSPRALELGKKNAQANHCTHQEFWREEIYPVIWQLAGRSLPGRAARRPQTLRLSPQNFDLVVLDPPARSKGFFGAVDVVRDYPSLAAPCFRILAPGGTLLACNNVGTVRLADFQAQLVRTAERQGRLIESIHHLTPEADFPVQGDEPALKILVVRVV